jgi:hypothetical protein
VIIKILLQDNTTGEMYTMMFGNSYKRWQSQYSEYMRMAYSKTDRSRICDRVRVVRAWYSLSKWIGYGGLKWCSSEEFQGELDDEARGLKLRRARKYEDMNFVEMGWSDLIRKLELSQ